MRRFMLDWRGCSHFHIWDMSWDLLYMQIYENAKQKLEHNEITLDEFEEMIKPLETALYSDIGFSVNMKKGKNHNEIHK